MCSDGNWIVVLLDWDLVRWLMFIALLVYFSLRHWTFVSGFFRNYPSYKLIIRYRIGQWVTVLWERESDCWFIFFDFFFSLKSVSILSQFSQQLSKQHGTEMDNMFFVELWNWKSGCIPLFVHFFFFLSMFQTLIGCATGFFFFSGTFQVRIFKFSEGDWVVLLCNWESSCRLIFIPLVAGVFFLSMF